MAKHSAPLTKPDYRIWLNYFCTPFFLVLLSSFMLFVARKRQGVMDWSLFFGQRQTEWWFGVMAFLVLLILPLPIQLCAQAQLDAKCEPSIKCFLKLLCDSFPLLNRMRVYLFSCRVDLLICARKLKVWMMHRWDCAGSHGLSLPKNLPVSGQRWMRQTRCSLHIKHSAGAKIIHISYIEQN